MDDLYCGNVYTSTSNPIPSMSLYIHSRKPDCSEYDFSFSTTTHYGSYPSSKLSYVIRVFDVDDNVVASFYIDSNDYEFERDGLNGTKIYYYNYENFDLSNYTGNIEELRAQVFRYKVNACVSYGAELATFINITPSSYTRQYLPPCIPNVDTDRDNDGITNSSDNCPDNYNPDQADSDGDGIGDVCDSTSKPDLTADKSNIIIYSDCSSCPSQLSNLGSKRHLVYKQAGSINFQQMIIDNKGTAKSPNSKVNFYFSANSKYESNNDTKIGSVSTPEINPNSYKVLSKTLFGNDFPSVSSGNYYILMIIDGDKNVDESDETNNTFSIPITLKQNVFGKPIDLNGLNSFSHKPYSLYIYNFHGKLIKKVEVNDKGDEISSVKNLPNGMYILNSINGSRKISVNNN